MGFITIEGKLVSEEGVREGRITIDSDSGLITEVGEKIGQADISTDALIFPGFGDLHVHAREDVSGKDIHKEDFETASAAAIHGGVTFFAEMPNNPVPPIDAASYEAKRKLADKAIVDVLLYGAIGKATRPLPFKAPYKIFTGRSVGDIFFKSLADVRETLEKYRGENVSFHAEDPAILDAHNSEVTHEKKRPPEAEIAAIDFAIQLIEEFNLAGKICHLSTGAGLQKIRAAKARGLAITAEVTPHHLYFDQTMLTDANRKWFQMNPPLRLPEDRLALIEGLRDGSIDYLASDHAPHTRAEKAEGASGVPHLDTFGAFTTWLMAEHGFRPADIARIASTNPGRFVQPFLPKKFGKIEPGYAGSLTLLDPQKPWTVRREDLLTKCGWSPFEGLTFPGSVYVTIVKGKVYTQASSS